MNPAYYQSAIQSHYAQTGGRITSVRPQCYYGQRPTFALTQTSTSGSCQCHCDQRPTFALTQMGTPGSRQCHCGQRRTLANSQPSGIYFVSGGQYLIVSQRPVVNRPWV